VWETHWETHWEARKRGSTSFVLFFFFISLKEKRTQESVYGSLNTNNTLLLIPLMASCDSESAGVSLKFVRETDPTK